MNNITRDQALNITQQNCFNEESLIRNLVASCGGYIPRKFFDALFSYLNEDAMNSFKWRLNRFGLEINDVYVRHIAVNRFTIANQNVCLALLGVAAILDSVTGIFRIENNPPYLFLVSTKNAFYKVAVMDESNKLLINTIMEYDKDNERLEKQYRTQKIIVFEVEYEDEYFDILYARSDSTIKLCLLVDQNQEAEQYYFSETVDSENKNCEQNPDACEDDFDDVENVFFYEASKAFKARQNDDILEGGSYDS